MQNLLDFFKSKKGWALMTGISSLLLFHFFEIPEDVSNKFLGMIGAYIVGQGMADIGKNLPK